MWSYGKWNLCNCNDLRVKSNRWLLILSSNTTAGDEQSFLQRAVMSQDNKKGAWGQILNLPACWKRVKDGWAINQFYIKIWFIRQYDVKKKKNKERKETQEKLGNRFSSWMLLSCALLGYRSSHPTLWSLFFHLWLVTSCTSFPIFKFVIYFSL